jgi:hypothetical protein
LTTISWRRRHNTILLSLIRPNEPSTITTLILILLLLHALSPVRSLNSSLYALNLIVTQSKKQSQHRLHPHIIRHQLVLLSPPFQGLVLLEMLEQSFSDVQQLLAMLILLFRVVVNVEPELPPLVRQ